MIPVLRCKYSRRHNRKGFTIVELLIVIVVIGILASIVIVSYTGIQNKAKNARFEAAVDGYTKALTAYRQNYGTYPSTAAVSGGYVCLGDKYPLRDGFAAGSCFKGAVAPSYTVNTALTSAVGELLGNQPDTSDMLSADQSSRGLFYTSTASDLTQAQIFYRAQGNQDCARGTKVTGSDSNGPYTACIIPLN